MSISIEELNSMNPDSYQIIDIRDEAEIGHGAIPGAVAVAIEEIEGNEKIDFSKKLGKGKIFELGTVPFSKKNRPQFKIIKNAFLFFLV